MIQPSRICEVTSILDVWQGTKVEKAIEYLFVGHYSNHIECVDVDFRSVTRQPFMEIQLEVTGCKDLYASLDKFCEVEKLEHPNRYHAEGHGLVVSCFVAGLSAIVLWGQSCIGQMPVKRPKLPFF